MVRWWTNKEKNLLNIFGNILKAVLVTFRDFAEKQKTILKFQKTFDNPLAKYLFYKEFLEGIDYILSYLPKSKSTQWISASKKTFWKENFMTPFHGWTSTVSKLQSHEEEIFPWKLSLYKTLSIDQVSKSKLYFTRY